MVINGIRVFEKQAAPPDPIFLGVPFSAEINIITRIDEYNKD